ncbi:GbsR/MarR family transcriptional regulator [Streptomonospora nanhaiensis]|uniref:Putative ArsR family transcriptional regulator n=1 Tax=Streptomonospora nanhaiensis TaxID=1323731 RepID=A0A853BTX6_9ACTN|nr:MarR family transcriptional regulator [Streptomonospora nanhaiensis]NYI98414.1 putative ArsR family transcriptional regulator [Streptomonospora nanhaiensis]
MADAGDDARDMAERRYAERFAVLLWESGYPRMAARVFASILTAENGRRTAADLAERLQVGPSAISGAVKYLIDVGMVVREREPGQRRDHYCARPSAWFDAVAANLDVFTRFETGAREGVEVFGAGTPVGERLDEVSRAFAFLRREIPLLLEKWRAQEAERTAPTS